jgi:PAS domain S-box-containing protein
MEEARLAAIVASSDDAIVSKTLEGRITSWNTGAARIFGYQASEMIGQSIMRIIPPELHPEEERILAQMARGEHVDHYETVRVAKDGRRVDISLTVSPLRDSSGRVIGASKVARDITERKQAEKLQRLLAEELNHRVKNTLATVQAIASQSLARARSPGDFVASFTGRVQALARAHALLTQRSLQGAEVGELVRDQVLLGAGADDRFACSGPRLMLDAQASVHLGLVLHELGTNARKHGALSVPQGRLSVSWAMRTNGRRSLLLEWKESNGPKVSAPAAHGFGSALIEQTLRTHGGEAHIHYGANGVTCEIKLPLPNEARLPAGAAAMPQAEAMVREPQSGQTQLEGKRILVVEDEPLLAMDMEAMLAAAGCSIVGPAGALDQAKLLIAQEECDAALLDANLAGRSVDDLAAALTQRNIPFAFVTGYGRDGLPQGFREALLLGKPFGCDQLLAMVGTLLFQDASVVRLKRKST